MLSQPLKVQHKYLFIITYYNILIIIINIYYCNFRIMFYKVLFLKKKKSICKHYNIPILFKYTNIYFYVVCIFNIIFLSISVLFLI